MPTNPLFVPTYEKLVSQLRLSTAVQPDGGVMIDNAINTARVRLYSALGVDQINAIKAIAYSDEPTDDNGILRLKASIVETLIVRIELMRVMPTLFVDGASIGREVWNQEPFTRLNTGQDVQIKAMEDQVSNYIDELEDTGSPEDEDFQISSIGPDIAPQRPGDTIRNCLGGLPQYPSGDF